MIIFTPFACVVMFFSLLGLKKPMSYIMGKITWVWSSLSIIFTGCPVTIKGRENIPPSGGYCVVANHSSIFDIILILAAIRRTVGFIAKKELAMIPLLNMYVLLLGGLFIDRKNVRKALGTIKKGIEHIKKGQVMLIFPEGHRSRGKGLLPFKPGALKLATRAETKILPVAIQGSYDVFEKTGRIRPLPVEVYICPPVDTAGMGIEERRVLSDKIRAIIAEKLNLK
jgi:1-acyl-sn-glycerol-3-phosphate acyltransferase